ncbi:hypothetical protein AWM75_00415 [Aerococcus urinaehominis]|uniref:Uncharacterized protein n=1 Tax=Aerococcus urinaehominis TaxID=128944 RepID=A0A109RG42_9LACT|nr:protein-ADP-ribose hydrolase [Aerococcus urinaehominis]AMB98546.1 hypothetical protein AWM75_00415 [Aerococcus urinaehominis]SDL78594.1 O-acetyl-ADP-ribose deacetylase (regulator of RNase III), contains Macro domain [Aerococcus urinaehominis]
MKQTDRLKLMVGYLEGEYSDPSDYQNLPAYNLDDDDQNQLTKRQELANKWRQLVNVRPAKPASDQYLSLQDTYLALENNDGPTYGFTDGYIKSDQISLWQGDITQLAVDAIVNAANNQAEGCFIPGHNCIDNIIHTKAGIQLRLDMHQQIKSRGRKLATGQALISSAYNLPATYVIHTVGPVVQGGQVTDIKADQLAQCYQSCLALAEEKGLKTIAFCCIATGVFGYPADQAAQVAIKTVENYISQENSQIKVIFNVFTDQDLAIYADRLGIDLEEEK